MSFEASEGMEADLRRIYEALNYEPKNGTCGSQNGASE